MILSERRDQTYTSVQIFQLEQVQQLLHLTQEEAHVILLDNQKKVRASRMVYRGTSNEIPTRVAEFLRPALLLNQPCMVMVHNHPSGDPNPSAADVARTKEVKEAAAIMGITLLDHLVVGSEGFVSMYDRGIIK